MLLERTANARDVSSIRRQSDPPPPPSLGTNERPLMCMMYFFASQMNWNISTSSTPEQHPLDKLLSKVGIHAAFSPHVTQFETFPVEIPQPPGRKSKVSREVNHDTMLFMKFRSKRAREEWIATKEWREFMEKTESEGVFRRIPHVRCAGSLRGLSDPMEVLGI
jgi:hypothetical protein